MMGFSRESQVGRSSGVHLSDIIRALMQRLEKDRTVKKYGPSFDIAEGVPARVEAGILWEPILEESLRRKYATIRPAEIVSPEGIAMSPDGLNPVLMAGEEYKLTWKSCRGGLVDEYGMPREKFLPWFVQMKGYAKWLEVDRFILRVFFVNGDYSRGPDGGPQLKSYDLRFTEDEIDENWRLILAVAREEGLL